MPAMSRPSSSRALMLVGCLCAAVMVQAASEADREADELFKDRPPLKIEVTLPDSQWAILQSAGMQQRRAKPSAKAQVREGGREYPDVAVSLKGFSTFEPLDGRPSLTLDFNEHIRGQKFHGLTKISLNNSAQDPSRLNERLAREVMAKAGLPVPRATLASVSLNGRNLGLYVLAEAYGGNFLKRQFGDPSGNFYEGGALRDVDRGLQWKSGPVPEDRTDLTRLLQAVKEPDPTRRFAALTNLLDLDRFLTLMAVETMLCHSDCYALNRNNYRIYHEPKSDRLVFLPHGMDRILGSHRTGPDLPVVPPARGIVARALLSTSEGRRRYVAQAEAVFTNVLQTVPWCDRIRALEQVTGRQSSTASFASWAMDDGPAASGGAALCRRLKDRIEELRVQFLARETLAAVPPRPDFDEAGTFGMRQWAGRPTSGQRRAEAFAGKESGQIVVRLGAYKSNPKSTLACVLDVPRGSYRLTGRMRVVSPADATVSLTVLRFQQGDRVATERHRLGNRELNYPLEVSGLSGGEEIHFLCDISNPDEEEVLLDASGLKLVRAEPSVRRITPP